MHTWPHQRRVRAGHRFLPCCTAPHVLRLGRAEETNDLTIDQKYVAQFAVPASDLKVTTWVDHKDDTYRVGDTLKLFVKTNLDAFITVVDVGTSGKVVVLFPNKHASDNRIGADKVLEIPGPKAPYDIRVSGPAGQELIKVIATTRPGAIIRADQLSELGPFQSYSGSAESFTKDLAIELKPTPPRRPALQVLYPRTQRSTKSYASSRSRVRQRRHHLNRRPASLRPPPALNRRPTPAPPKALRRRLRRHAIRRHLKDSRALNDASAESGKVANRRRSPHRPSPRKILSILGYRRLLWGAIV